MSWNCTIDSVFKEFGLKSLVSDCCIYIASSDGSLSNASLMLVLYVDDVLYAGELSVFNRFEAFMKAKFELRLTNEAKYFIGFQIEQKGDYILVHQTKYIQDIVKKLDRC